MEMESRILDKLDRLSDDIYEVKVQLSKLPAEFVTKAELEKAHTAALSAKRWAIGTALMLFGLGIQVYIAIF